MARATGSLRASGRSGQAPAIAVQVRITGVERTSQAFKDARRNVNTQLRDAIETAGTRTVLPKIKANFPSDRFAATLFVKRDRTTVFIGSRARGKLNRTVGWLDFGGRRPRDSVRRTGTYVIVETLDRERDAIDRAILQELPRVFYPLEVR